MVFSLYSSDVFINNINATLIFSKKKKKICSNILITKGVFCVNNLFSKFL